MKPEEKLQQAAEQYRQAIAERDALTQKANADREAVIREADAAGMTRRTIAQHVGLSFQRVQQILKPDKR